MCRRMPPRRAIVVVGASAGGLDPLRALLRGLPGDLHAALFVVLHIPATGGSALPRILDRSGPLRADTAVDGEPIESGRVYVAPPDQHLLVVEDAVRLSRGPRRNGVRPAADPLFRSAALQAGPRVTAVVLSGTLGDGALGSATVERRGGRVVVQDPDEAEYDSMPRSAIAVTGRPVVVPASGLADQVTRLAASAGGGPAIPGTAGPAEPDEELAAEIRGLLDGSLETKPLSPIQSGLTCPECGDPLYFAHRERADTYDCLAGHRWSPRSLVDQHSTVVDRELRLAIRSLEERGRLTARLAETARQRGHLLSATRFALACDEAGRSADALRVAVRAMSAEVAAEPGEA
jgi:two-component system, chemotaxis family, protein-glutamate methylesterase/glutaminase